MISPAQQLAAKPRSAPRPILQRKCACGGTPTQGGECEECRKKKLQRRAFGPGPEEAPHEVGAVLAQQGSQLPPDLARDFSGRFGYDFSSVRVHTGAAASRSAERVNAEAYTVGRHVVFGSGAWNPHSSAGSRLLAHELAHVVQQKASADVTGPIPVQSAASPHERAADRAADTALSLSPRPDAPLVSTPALARQEAKPAAPATAKKCSDAAKLSSCLKQVRRGKGGGTICLTFDDGPGAGTQDILDALATHSAPATFFLVGRGPKSAAAQTPLLAKIQAAGHAIANHTMTHDPAGKPGYKKAYGDKAFKDKAAKAKFDKNLTDNEAHFAKIAPSTATTSAGKLMPLARLPGDGRTFNYLLDEVKALGLTHVGWQYEFSTNGTMPCTVCHYDWQGVTGVSSTFSDLPKDKDVVLAHDGHWSGQKAPFEALLAKLKSLGFSFGILDTSGKCVPAPPKPASAPSSRPMSSSETDAGEPNACVDPAYQTWLDEPQECVDPGLTPLEDNEAQTCFPGDEVLDGDFPEDAELSVSQPEGEEAGVCLQRQEKDKGKDKLDPKPKAPANKITKVDVDLTSQKMVINWSDGTKSNPITISSGKGKPGTKGDPCTDPTKDGSLCTPSGSFSVGKKGGKGYTNKKGDKMSYYTEFLSARGIGIHNSQKVTGAPASHGCVRVDEPTAKTINEHSDSSTAVEVTGTAPTKPPAPKPVPKKSTPAPKKKK